jgi:hypothetical protein
VPALQAAPVLRPVGKAFGVQLRVGHCPNVLHRLRTLLPGAAASQGAQSNDDTTAGEAAPPPRLIVSPPVPISQVGANALMVHSNAVTMLGVVGAVAQRQAQAVVCLHHCLTFGEQGEPPRFEFSFRPACQYALYGRCVPVSRRIVPGLLPVRTCANGGGATSHIRLFGSARLKRASTDAATRAGAAAG